MAILSRVSQSAHWLRRISLAMNSRRSNDYSGVAQETIGNLVAACSLENRKLQKFGKSRVGLAKKGRL